ncbi:MAG: secG [Gammaproteobacteria bacterium]|jgi:preprotein translocase subunit SecG|nr:secG [Gammaproteobacteria bacterium]
MQQLLLLVHVLISLLLIVLVLLQQGKGAEVGASFGSGASQTIFGSQGSGSFMLKFTSGVAVLFFITSLALGYVAAHSHKQQNQVNTRASMPVDVTQPKDNISALQTGQAQPDRAASKG